MLQDDENGYKYICFVLRSNVLSFLCAHLSCSVQLSMSNMEKRYRNKIIIISIIKKANKVEQIIRQTRSTGKEKNPQKTRSTSR